jgi:hypothetical protein
MVTETFKTLLLDSFFVFLFGVLGFLIAIILNALRFYVEAPTNNAYLILVVTRILSFVYFPYYLLASTLFAGLGIFSLYIFKEK